MQCGSPQNCSKQSNNMKKKKAARRKTANTNNKNRYRSNVAHRKTMHAMRLAARLYKQSNNNKIKKKKFAQGMPTPSNLLQFAQADLNGFCETDFVIKKKAQNVIRITSHNFL
jgi:hypothetical protein